MNLRIGMDNVENRNIFPYRDLNSHPGAVQPAASRYIGINTLRTYRVFQKQLHNGITNVAVWRVFKVLNDA
jgi:hypothetical protein